MKLITTLFTGEDLEATMVIQPRQKGNQDPNPDEPLISRYVSRIGNLSLIFNPKAYMQLRSKTDRNRPSAIIPMEIAKRFSRALGKSYECLGAEKLYHGEGGSVYVDTKKAAALARRLSLFRGELTLIPGVVSSRGTKGRGLAVLLDGNLVGTLTHNESLNLYDLVDRLDPLACEFMSAIADEMQRMDTKLDRILDILQRMEYANSRQDQPETAGFAWTPVSDNPNKFVY